MTEAQAQALIEALNSIKLEIAKQTEALIEIGTKGPNNGRPPR